MSDDKKVIFSMSGVTKTFPGAQTPVLKNIYLSFFYGAKIGCPFSFYCLVTYWKLFRPSPLCIFRKLGAAMSLRTALLVILLAVAIREVVPKSKSPE